ncbi:RNase H domain-containing protein [Trichonephila clavipes]|nr:RNase H domain-containing protein [Trichonephila clavipes]
MVIKANRFHLQLQDTFARPTDKVANAYTIKTKWNTPADDSCLDRDGAGRCIFSNTSGNDVKISIRNPDHCSGLRLELIAISGALDHALNSYKDSIWILTYSRSSIQYLKNWPKIMDSIGLDILSKLARLG